MPEHKVGTREEWQAARDELAKLEAEQAQSGEEIKRKRRELTEEQAQQIPEVKEMVEQPPEWLEFWAEQVGAELKDGLREAPGYIAFARENGTVYHTYTVTAPDPFVSPFFSSLLDRTPKPQPDEPFSFRKDEYPD